MKNNTFKLAQKIEQVEAESPKKLLSLLVASFGHTIKNREKIRAVFKLFLQPLLPLFEDFKPAKKAYYEIFKSAYSRDFDQYQCSVFSDFCSKISTLWERLSGKIERQQRAGMLSGVSLIKAECQRDALFALSDALYLAVLMHSDYWREHFSFSEEVRLNQIDYAVSSFMQKAIKVPIRLQRRDYSECARDSYFTSYDKIKACLQS